MKAAMLGIRTLRAPFSLIIQTLAGGPSSSANAVKPKDRLPNGNSPLSPAVTAPFVTQSPSHMKAGQHPLFFWAPGYATTITDLRHQIDQLPLPPAQLAAPATDFTTPPSEPGLD